MRRHPARARAHSHRTTGPATSYGIGRDGFSPRFLCGVRLPQRGGGGDAANHRGFPSPHCVRAHTQHGSSSPPIPPDVRAAGRSSMQPVHRAGDHRKRTPAHTALTRIAHPSPLGQDAPLLRSGAAPGQGLVSLRAPEAVLSVWSLIHATAARHPRSCLPSLRSRRHQLRCRAWRRVMQQSPDSGLRHHPAPGAQSLTAPPRTPSSPPERASVRALHRKRTYRASTVRCRVRAPTAPSGSTSVHIPQITKRGRAFPPVGRAGSLPTGKGEKIPLYPLQSLAI